MDSLMRPLAFLAYLPSPVWLAHKRPMVTWLPGGPTPPAPEAERALALALAQAQTGTVQRKK